MAKKQMVEEKQARVRKLETEGLAGYAPDALAPGPASLQQVIGNRAVQRVLTHRSDAGIKCRPSLYQRSRQCVIDIRSLAWG